MRLARVVEPRRANDSRPRTAAEHSKVPDDATRARRAIHRHEINDLELRLVADEPRHEHVGIANVSLLRSRLPHRRRDRERPAALRVQQPGEHCRRIELGKAEKIDRAVDRDESGRLQIADETVFRDLHSARCPASKLRIC